MSEEEKKAIAFLKFYCNDSENEYFDENYCFDKKYAKTIIKLIDKKQKEIEELEVCLQAEEKYAEGLNNDIKSLLNIEPNNNFISKDKIREKIKEIENEHTGSTRNALSVLQELLEE